MFLQRILFVAFFDDCDLTANLFDLNDQRCASCQCIINVAVIPCSPIIKGIGKIRQFHLFCIEIQFFGTTTDENLLYIKDYFQDAKIQDITWANEDSILVLTDGKLWFYGNYQYLTEGVGDSKTSKELKLLCENVCSVSSNAWNALGALDSENQFFVWGRCLTNDAEHIEEPEYEYVEKRLISDCAKAIHLSGATISYIDVNGASHIYHSGGWIDFYGNSTNDKQVGINREPVTWIKPEK